MLISSRALNLASFAQLEQLVAECCAVDGNYIPVYPSIIQKMRPLPYNLLYYDNDRLVGFLAPFFFHPNQAEFSVVVAPSHRRRGIASALINAMRPIIASYGIDTLVFVAPKDMLYPWGKALGFRHEQRAYEMVKTLSVKPPMPTIGTVRAAMPSDKAIMLAIDSVCFPGPNFDKEALFASLIVNPEYSILLLEDKGILGKAHLHWQNTHVTLSDFAIFPEYQRLGYGRLFMEHILHIIDLKQYTQVRLHVKAENESALHLYQQYGFVVINTCDYWVVRESDLKNGQ